jgi:hypothetical protein
VCRSGQARRGSAGRLKSGHPKLRSPVRAVRTSRVYESARGDEAPPEEVDLAQRSAGRRENHSEQRARGHEAASRLHNARAGGRGRVGQSYHAPSRSRRVHTRRRCDEGASHHAVDRCALPLHDSMCALSFAQLANRSSRAMTSWASASFSALWLSAVGHDNPLSVVCARTQTEKGLLIRRRSRIESWAQPGMGHPFPRTWMLRPSEDILEDPMSFRQPIAIIASSRNLHTSVIASG